MCLHSKQLGRCSVWLSRVPGRQLLLASKAAWSSRWLVRFRWLAVVACLVGRLAAWRVGWLAGCLDDGCSMLWMTGCRVVGCLLFGGLVDLLFGWLGWLVWLNPPTPGPKPRGPHREGRGGGPKPTKPFNIFEG